MLPVRRLQDHERIITTVGDFLAGESLRYELNEMLSEAMDWQKWDGASCLHEQSYVNEV